MASRKRGLFSGLSPSNRKGGDPRARARRARQAHARRRSRNLLTGGGEHYRGSSTARTRPSWIWR
jgi:hypothetical protein